MYNIRALFYINQSKKCFVSKLFIVLFTYLSTIFSSNIAMSYLSELVYMYLYVYLYGGVCICVYL